jgi:signal transduction histidine kinase
MGAGLALNARKKNGEVFPVEISLGNYEWAGERLAVAFITDISAWKKVEAELLISKHKLDEEALALKQLNDAGNRLWQIDNLNEGLAEVLRSSLEMMGAEKGNIQFVDEKEKVLRMAAHIGFDPAFLEYFDEVSAADDSACARAWQNKSQVFVADTEKEWSGGRREIARTSAFRTVLSTPIFNRDGSIIAMISTHFTQVTEPDELAFKRMQLYARSVQGFIERVRNYEVIKRYNQELEERVSLEREKHLNELKSRFVSMASHEFRTPLTIILSSVSLIEYHAGAGDEVLKKHLSKIKTSVHNLTSILGDFLSLDKLEQNKVEIEWENIDVTDFIREILEEAVVVQKRGQQIQTFHAGDAFIRSDRKKLRYAFSNLLSNAIKYSPEGTFILLNTAVVGKTFTISVQDFGMGIPDEDQPHLFDKFFRGKNAAAIQGTGLGLTIIKRYVELLGGQIEVKSKANEGTTFSIQLPLSE